jgi:5,10-methylenetetrahydromethanopterin reductase
MKIGTSLGISQREPISHTVEVVQNAEKLGFDSAWIADVQMSMKDCYTALPLCAVNTSDILLATGVTNPITRHPSTIACSFTALNEVSNGRAVIGLGSGWTAVHQVGLKPSKIKNLEVSINNIHAMCEGKEVEGPHGDPYRLVTATGRIPIFVAANQPKILQMVGRVADGAILMGGANVDFTGWQIDQVRKGAEEVGRDFNEIEIHLWAAISMNEDRDMARDDVSHWAASQAESFATWKMRPDFMAPFEEDFDRAHAAYDKLEHMSSHSSHKTTVSPEFIDWVSLVGTPDDCLENIKELEKLGLHGVTLAFRAGGMGRLARMEQISDQLIKHLK